MTPARYAGVIFCYTSAMPDILPIRLIRKYEQFCKFLVAGAFVVAINLSLLYMFTDMLHVYYLVSTVLAFLIAFGVSFLIQKNWTFKDRSRDQLHKQLPLYLFAQLVNLACNTSLMYLFVEYLHVWYILSQAIIAFGLAMVMFLINKAFIFNGRQISR